MSSFLEYSTSVHSLLEWISKAPTQLRHPMRAPTVITTVDNIPNARTMILRDVCDNGLIFFTDKRSSKIHDITINPHGTIHSYDTKKKLQIRIRAHISCVVEHPQLHRWRSIGLNRFQDYGSSISPGTPIENSQIPAPTLDIARENFCILMASVTDIELLKLSRQGHQRIEWSLRENRWTFQRLVP